MANELSEYQVKYHDKSTTKYYRQFNNIHGNSTFSSSYVFIWKWNIHTYFLGFFKKPYSDTESTVSLIVEIDFYYINVMYLTILILFLRTSHSLISHMEELFKYVRGAEEEEEK